MNVKRFSRFTLMAFAMVALALAVGGSGVAQADHHLNQYEVTILNLTAGQPLSPAVLATHRSTNLMAVGHPAFPELEAVAENGNQIPLFELLNDTPGVTDVVDVGMPLTPIGATSGDFADRVTVEISAAPGDRLSLATMLICTNDGLALLQQAELPSAGTAVYPIYGYDAGTEDNTELSEDLVDPCSGLGPVGLDGDPNGNNNATVDTAPQGTIQHHPGIQGAGDLLAAHGWQGPVAVVVITPAE